MFFVVILLIASLLVLLVGVAIHLYYLRRLRQWALNFDEKLPDGIGLWADTFAALRRRMRRHSLLMAQQQQQISQFQEIASGLPDGVVILNQHDCIEWANQPALQWLALDIKKDIGLPLANLVRQPQFIDWLTSHDGKTTLHMHAMSDDSLMLALRQVSFGEGWRTLLIRDVTLYEQNMQIRRDFIASASHELKTPLTVIVGFLEILQDMSQADSEEKRYLTLMQQQASGMQRLVEDLLTLSALESGQKHEEESWFAVTPFLQQLLEQAQVLSQGKHTISLQQSGEAELFAMHDELVSAVGNLLANAIHYTPEGGTIELRFAVDDKLRASIAVRDSGIGIAAEHLPRLTERFYRVDRSRSRASGGTGLGLAIVKHVLRQHQSELLIDSTPGKGSTFSFVLGAERVAGAGGK